MARQFGTDGTKDQGGDLGWFSQGRMVKEFEAAVFNSTKKGLLSDPVTTQFGYHIIKVTETKTSKKYYLASIDKTITSGDDTRDSVYSKAETLALNSKDAAGLDQYLKANPGLGNKMSAPNIMETSTYVNNLANPKELIRWIFTEAKEGNISPVFEVDNQYVVAVLRNKYDKGKVNMESVKFQVAFSAANEKKAEKILEKIGSDVNNLEQVVSKIGNNIVVNSATDVSLSAMTLGNAGFEPEAVGAILGLQKGQTSKPIKGNGGVILVTNVASTKPAELADYSIFKNQLFDFLRSSF